MILPHPVPSAEEAPGRARTALTVFLCTLLFLTPACRTSGDPKAITPPVSLPETLLPRDAALETAPRPSLWWRSFEDSGLERMIGRVFSANLELRSAWHRLRQAQETARASGSALWPSADLQLSGSRRRSTASSGFFSSFSAASGGQSQFANTAFYSNDFSVQVVPSYEVDLWRRIASSKNAADFEAAASRHLAEAVGLTLASRTAELWYTIAELNLRERILKKRIETARRIRDLTRLRYLHGLTSLTELESRDQELSALQELLPRLRTLRQQTRNLLAVLSGRAPQEMPPVRSSYLPSCGPLPDPGLPAALLERRPDVRAALEAAIAANYRIEAARAEQFPLLRLSGTIGGSSSRTNRIFEDWVGSIAASLSQSLFDAGRRQANVERARAAAAERITEYGRTVLTALREVDDAVTRERNLEDVSRSITRRLRLARATFDGARNRYAAGQIDYLELLRARLRLLELEQAALLVRRDRVLARVALFQALGADWSLAPDADVTPQTVASREDNLGSARLSDSRGSS